MKKIITIIIFFICVVQLYGQDPNFSQFYNTPEYYNPSLSSHYREITATVAYRNQWPKIPGNNGTEYFNFMYSFCNVNGFRGLGFTAFANQEGQNWLQTKSIGINPIFGVSTGKLSYNLCLSPNITQKTINYNGLIFSDQLDDVEQPTNITQFVAPGTGNQRIFLDLNWGFSVKFENFHKNPQVRHLTIYGGLSELHANKSDQSFTGAESILPPKWVGYLSGIVPLRHVNLNPGLIWESQNKFTSVMIGTNIESPFLSIGCWYRGYSNGPYKNSDAIIIFTSLSFDPTGYGEASVEVGYSYDLTTSGLSYASGGSHELVINYKFLKKCSKRRAHAWGNPRAGECPTWAQKRKSFLYYDFKGYH